MSFLNFPIRPPKTLWNFGDVSHEDYENPYINAVYFIAIFISFTIYAHVLHFIPDSGIIAGLVGVSGAYLFLYKTIAYVYESLTEDKLEEVIRVEGSIAREFMVSLLLFFGATLTLWLWGYPGMPVPHIIELMHFFITYLIGVVIKFLMIKTNENHIFMFIICIVSLLILGYVFSLGWI